MKKVKAIKIDADKCCGCRACEVVCSTVHAIPKYSIVNPERSRIRVLFDPLENIYVPVLAGPYTEAKCRGRYIYTIDGKEYEKCSFCRVSCPSRSLFREPDSGLPLKCDMCESEPDGPMCVQWCTAGALSYVELEEEEEEVGEEEKRGEIEAGLQELVNRHGFKDVMDTLGLISKD